MRAPRNGPAENGAPDTDAGQQLAQELLREAGFLSERSRLWLLEQLRQEFAATDLERMQLDRIGARMGEAVSVLQSVADHLKLDKTEERLGLTMREFDQAPASVRKGWSARRIADAIRGSWRTARNIAFTDTRLPVVAERKWELGKGLARKRREAAFTLSAIQAWLATDPPNKTQGAYQAWARSQNERGGRPLPLKKSIWHRWPDVRWPQIVEAVEAGRVPGEPDLQDADATTGEPTIPDAKVGNRSGRATPYLKDYQLRAKLIRETREARGLSIGQLAAAVKIDRSHLGKMEKGQARQPTFELIVKLANALDLSLDAFATRR